MFSWFEQGHAPEEGPDRYPLHSQDPNLAHQQTLGVYLEEMVFSLKAPKRPEDSASGALMLAQPEEAQGELVVAALGRWLWNARGGGQRRFMAGLKALLVRLLRRRLPMKTDALAWALESVAGLPPRFARDLPLRALLRQVEWAIDKEPPTTALRASLELLQATLPDDRTEDRQLLRRIQTALGQKDEGLFDPGEWWAQSIEGMLESASDEVSAAWTALFEHARTLKAASPSKRWRKQTSTLIDALGRSTLTAGLEDWFGRVGRCAPGAEHQPTVSERNAALLRGLVWCASLVASEPLARALAELTETSFRKLPDVGPRCPRVGNACISALATMGDAGLGRIVWLRQRLKYASALSRIDTALQAAATERGVAVADLEELAVPGCGLDHNGRVDLFVGRFIARIEIQSASKVTLGWLRPDGTPQKSTPTSVKRHYSMELERAKGLWRELQALLPAQRERLERLWHGDRCWGLDVWKARYLNHPVMRVLTRRLIWTVQRGPRRTTVIWSGDQLVDVQDRPVNWLDHRATVHLWHPLESDMQTRKAWQRWLLDHEVTQPFKQAHRELYPLTAPERQTVTFSDRFAANILRQHQLAALCKQRGWRYHMQGPGFGGRAMPVLMLPAWGLQAELQVSPVEHQRTRAQSGLALFVVAQRVRLRWLKDTPEAGKLCPLEDVPMAVFSEVMHDIEMFVAVCSAGRDNHYRSGKRQPSAPPPPYTPALHRNALLRTIMPRIPLATRCRVEAEHLRVRTTEGLYHINLRNAEVTHPDTRKPVEVSVDKDFELPFALPFEGDRVLESILARAWSLIQPTRTMADEPAVEPEPPTEPPAPVAVQTCLAF